MKSLADKLWLLVQPALACGYLQRSAECFHYRLKPSDAAVHQAEGLLVALETTSLRDAFTAFCAAERWGGLVRSDDYELKALLYAATSAAGERIAMALPARGRGEEQTTAFAVDSKGARVARVHSWLSRKGRA